MNAHTTLSNADRATVRKAITADQRWTAYRLQNGIAASDLTSARCLELAALWNLDVSAILAGDTTI